MGSIMRRIKENKEIESRCGFHEFVVDGFASKYECKHCGTTQTSEFILGYARGLQHALEQPDKAERYLKYFDSRG